MLSGLIIFYFWGLAVPSLLDMALAMANKLWVPGSESENLDSIRLWFHVLLYWGGAPLLCMCALRPKFTLFAEWVATRSTQVIRFGVVLTSSWVAYRLATSLGSKSLFPGPLQPVEAAFFLALQTVSLLWPLALAIWLARYASRPFPKRNVEV